MTQRKSLALQAVTQVTQYLRVPRFDSIRSRILVLAVLSALIPAVVTFGVAYAQNRRALETRITQDLVSRSEQAAGAISLWLKQRLYDLRVFAGSDEVARNLNRYASQGLASPRLREYLRSLHERFSDFDQILVADPDGRVLAASGGATSDLRLPADWQRLLRQEGQVVGDAYWDEGSGRATLTVAVPVNRADGQLLGAFAAKLNVEPMHRLLQSYAADSTVGLAGSGVSLVSDSGAVLVGPTGATRELLATRMRADVLARLRGSGREAVSFDKADGAAVLGALTPVPQARWFVLAETRSDAAFEQVSRFRSFAILIMLIVLAVVGATAYRLGMVIVRPLERLAVGANQVARGGLDVDLPDSGAAGEVRALTGIFNHMVSRLRAGRQEVASANAALKANNEELERLSITDGLTGVANHRALMLRLHEETQRADRTRQPFSVIMADVDEFKAYNDDFGHPAGDEVLKQVSNVLRECTRAVDCVGRYGGEEFAVVLPQSDMSGALEVAERIRARMESANVPGRRVTLSLGVAEFPRDGANAQAIMKTADAALYVAKRGGRNQVAQAKQAAPKQQLPTSRARGRKSAAARPVSAKGTAPARKPAAKKKKKG